MQSAESRCEVLRVDFLVRRLLVAHLPAMRRAGRRRDEEQLVGFGSVQVAVDGLGGGGAAEVHADAVAHDGLTVEGLLNGDGGVGGEEGDDDAAHGLDRCPRVYGDMLVYYVADRLEVVLLEDGSVVQVLVAKVSIVILGAI